MTVLDAAFDYLRAGLSPIPVRSDGSKAPVEPNWTRFAERRALEDQLVQWFGNGKVFGIGIAGGKASGNLAVLDFETTDSYIDWRRLVPADTMDALSECPIVRTPSGGFHVWCRLSEPASGTVLARRPDPDNPARGKVLVEIRGSGHQVVAPGSPASCHKTGKLYEFEGRGWLDANAGAIPIGVFVNWCEVAAGLNQWTPPRQDAPARPRRPDRDPSDKDPGTDFNRRGSWDEAGLFESGWSWVRQLDHDRGMIRRPGKTEGISGTVGIVSSTVNGWPLFYSFSTNCEPFQPNVPYDRFGVLTRLKFSGNFTEAAKWCLANGYGDPRRNDPVPVIGRPTDDVLAAMVDELERGDAWEAPDKLRESRFKFTDSSEFLAGEYRLEYHIPRVLVKGQPAILGGPHKTLKTSIFIDAGVSMATATPFLGKFPINRRSRVAICSGESGQYTLKETCLRVLDAKGIDPAELAGWLKWEFMLPTFTDVTVMMDFAEHLCRLEVEVAMIDPTYLALGDVDAKSVFDMGRVLRPVAEVLLARGITPVLAHHANRMLPVGEVMGLEHLSHAGFAEFSRQWLLLNRREKYTGDGNHALWMNIGGSAGHGGIWALDVEEGQLDEGFSKRRWDVRLCDINEVRTNEVQSREEAKAEMARKKIAHEQAQVLLAIDAECSRRPAATKTKIKERTGYATDKAASIITALLEDGAIEEHEFELSVGNEATRPAIGYRRFQATSGTPGDLLSGCTPGDVPQVEENNPEHHPDGEPPLGGLSGCPGVRPPASEAMPSEAKKKAKAPGVRRKKGTAKK